MNAHVDQERHVMFQDSADEVQQRLQALVRSVEEIMNQRVDEVFVAMRQDYRSVLGGNENVEGEVLPRAQRIMRKEVMKIIEGVEQMFNKVIGVADNDEKPTQEEVGGFPDDEDIPHHNNASPGSESSEHPADSDD